MAKLWKQEGQNVLLTSGKMTINDLVTGPLQFNVQGASYLNGLVGIQEPTPQGLLHVKGVDKTSSPSFRPLHSDVLDLNGFLSRCSARCNPEVAELTVIQ